MQPLVKSSVVRRAAHRWQDSNYDNDKYGRQYLDHDCKNNSPPTAMSIQIYI